MVLVTLTSHKTINNGSACSGLFLRTTGLFPARIKILEHETQLGIVTFFYVLETTLECPKTILSMLSHCLLRLVNYHKRHFSLPCISADFENVREPIRLREYC